MRWPDIFFKAKKRSTEPLIDNSIDDVPTENPAAPEELRKLPVSHVALPPAPVHPVAGNDSIVKDMAEADTLRQLSRSGAVRLIKRDFFAAAPKADAVPEPSLTERVEEAASPLVAEEPPQTAPATQRLPLAINLSGLRDAQPAAAHLPGTTIFKRRTKMADVARIVLPPRREEPSSSLPPPALAETRPLPSSISEAEPTAGPVEEFETKPMSSATIFPATFPVSMPTGGVLKNETPAFEPTEILSEKEPAFDSTTPTVPEEILSGPSKAEPGEEAHKAEAVATPEPDSPSLSAMAEPDPAEKKEFVLSNGERILGHILSETPECIYLNHATLGVLTIPRAQVAQRPVEIILMNGDRIVGDILAETTDSLFVRHASLGVLTVPKNQRSSRVVEAILKDGDRILGEVLGETGNFTVIRSATLGTVAVPHNRIALLNRRAEEVPMMKALPPGNPENPSQP